MLDRNRLAQLLAVTTSTFDGEALAAIRAANRLLEREKLTWHEALNATPPPPQPQTADDLPDPFAYCGGWRAVWTIIRASPDLTPWERQFIESMKKRRRPPSPKQAAILSKMFDKYG